MERKNFIRLTVVLILLLTLSLAGCNAHANSSAARTITFTDIPEDITLIVVSVDRGASIGSIAGGAAVKGGKLPNGDSWAEIKNGRAVVKLYDYIEALTYIQVALSKISISKPVKEQAVAGKAVVLVQPYKGTNPASPMTWGSEDNPIKFVNDNKLLRWTAGKIKQ